MTTMTAWASKEDQFLLSARTYAAQIHTLNRHLQEEYGYTHEVAIQIATSSVLAVALSELADCVGDIAINRYEAL